MLVVGREKERDLLSTCMGSGRPEFIVVYGRRRVGKTYLVKEYFKGRFAFYATGVTEVSLKAQLRSFNDSLLQYGGTDRSTPKDWFEAFSRLRALLEGPDVQKDSASGRRVVFLDELPWMDPPPLGLQERAGPFLEQLGLVTGGHDARRLRIGDIVDSGQHIRKQEGLLQPAHQEDTAPALHARRMR